MEALQLTASVQITELRDRAQFVALESEWNALVDACGAEPFLRHEFLRVWMDNFAPEAGLCILIARDGAGRLVAGLPLMEHREYWYGIPVRLLISTANPHSCRFDLLALEPDQSGPALFEWISRKTDWDVLRLIDIPEGGRAWHLFDYARRLRYPVGTWESLRSPYIPLPSSYEHLQGTLHSKFKANLRRRRKKLEALGPCEYEEVRSGLELAAKLEEGFALEQSGWKGKRGTAIAQSRQTRGFYSELARLSAHRRWLSLGFLRVSGRAVAFQYGLVSNDKYYLLKPGYDESLRECSPGQLLMEETTRSCVARGLREFDFLGPDMVWKRDWTDQVRAHTWLYVFRDSDFGRGLCQAKFRWAPRVKEVIAAWKR